MINFDFTGISPVKYKEIENLISDNIKLIFNGLSCLSNSRSFIENSKVSSTSTSKLYLDSYLSGFYYFLKNKHSSISPDLRVFISNMQRHTLLHYNTSGIDEFLKKNYLQVSREFADLSNFCGFNIGLDVNFPNSIGDKSARIKDIDDIFKDIELPLSKIGWDNE